MFRRFLGFVANTNDKKDESSDFDSSDKSGSEMDERSKHDSVITDDSPYLSFTQESSPKERIFRENVSDELQLSIDNASQPANEESVSSSPILGAKSDAVESTKGELDSLNRSFNTIPNTNSDITNACTFNGNSGESIEAKDEFVEMFNFVAQQHKEKVKVEQIYNRVNDNKLSFSDAFYLNAAFSALNWDMLPYLPKGFLSNLKLCVDIYNFEEIEQIYLHAIKLNNDYILKGFGYNELYLREAQVQTPLIQLSLVEIYLKMVDIFDQTPCIEHYVFKATQILINNFKHYKEYNYYHLNIITKNDFYGLICNPKISSIIKDNSIHEVLNLDLFTNDEDRKYELKLKIKLADNYLNKEFTLTGTPIKDALLAHKYASEVYKLAFEKNYFDEMKDALQIISSVYRYCGAEELANEYLKKSNSLVAQISNEYGLNISKFGVNSEYLINLQKAIQKPILDSVTDCALRGKWYDYHWLGQYGLVYYLDEKIIEKHVKHLVPSNLPEDLSKQHLDNLRWDTKKLIFQAICLGCSKNNNENIICALIFKEKHPKLIEDIAKNHPEYFNNSVIVKALFNENKNNLVNDFDSQNNINYEANCMLPVIENYTKNTLDNINYILNSSDESHKKSAKIISAASPEAISKILGNNNSLIENGVKYAQALMFKEIVKTLGDSSNAEHGVALDFCKAYPLASSIILKSYKDLFDNDLEYKCNNLINDYYNSSICPELNETQFESVMEIKHPLEAYMYEANSQSIVYSPFRDEEPYSESFIYRMFNKSKANVTGNNFEHFDD